MELPARINDKKEGRYCPSVLSDVFRIVVRGANRDGGHSAARWRSEFGKLRTRIAALYGVARASLPAIHSKALKPISGKSKMVSRLSNKSSANAPRLRGSDYTARSRENADGGRRV